MLPEEPQLSPLPRPSPLASCQQDALLSPLEECSSLLAGRSLQSVPETSTRHVSNRHSPGPAQNWAQAPPVRPSSSSGPRPHLRPPLSPRAPGHSPQTRRAPSTEGARSSQPCPAAGYPRQAEPHPTATPCVVCHFTARPLGVTLCDPVLYGRSLSGLSGWPCDNPELSVTSLPGLSGDLVHTGLPAWRAGMPEASSSRAHRAASGRTSQGSTVCTGLCWCRRAPSWGWAEG